MTAVEWLYERLERMIPRTALYNIDKKEYFEQSKEMEKQQQLELIQFLSEKEDFKENSSMSIFIAEDFLNEFKNK